MEMVNSDGACHGTYHWSDHCNEDHDHGDFSQMASDWNETYHEFAVSGWRKLRLVRFGRQDLRDRECKQRWSDNVRSPILRPSQHCSRRTLASPTHDENEISSAPPHRLRSCQSSTITIITYFLKIKFIHTTNT